MPYRGPAVEHEAGAMPLAVLLRHLLEILQDAALEVVDLSEALLQHEGRGLLAADAASTEHCHLAMLCRIEVLAHVGDEVRERLNAGIDGAVERAELGFVVIA